MEEPEIRDNGNSKYHVPSLERAMAVFELLADHVDGLSQTEIAELLDVPRNSIFRITMTLADSGYLYRDEADKKFRLTPKLLRIGYSAVGELKLTEKSLDIMKKLRDDLQETVLLGTLLKGRGIVLETITGGGLPFKLSVDPGSSFEIYCSAPGKAIANNLPENELDGLLDKVEFKAHNTNTLISKEEFKAHLREWRERGYFIDDEEEYRGLRCVGSPVLNRLGYPVAALWTAGPIDRFPMKKVPVIGKRVKECAAIISHRLGHLA